MMLCGFLAFAAPLEAPWWHLDRDRLRRRRRASRSTSSRSGSGSRTSTGATRAGRRSTPWSARAPSPPSSSSARGRSASTIRRRSPGHGRSPPWSSLALVGRLLRQGPGRARRGRPLRPARGPRGRRPARPPALPVGALALRRRQARSGRAAVRRRPARWPAPTAGSATWSRAPPPRTSITKEYAHERPTRARRDDLRGVDDVHRPDDRRARDPRPVRSTCRCLRPARNGSSTVTCCRWRRCSRSAAAWPTSSVIAGWS